MSRPANNLLNLKFGRLQVKSRIANDRKGNARWLCLCDCGTTVPIIGYHLTSGHTSSCGCLRIETSGKINLGKSLTKETREKISSSRLGFIPSLETRRKLSESGKGRGAGISKPAEVKAKISAKLTGRSLSLEHREQLLSSTMIQTKRLFADAARNERRGFHSDYRERDWVAAVKKRDNNTCQKCGKQNLVGRDCHAHHVKRWDKFPELRFVIENGQTLCSSCHRKESIREAKEIALTEIAPVIYNRDELGAK
jgi:hypothetical protein